MTSPGRPRIGHRELEAGLRREKLSVVEIEIEFFLPRRTVYRLLDRIKAGLPDQDRLRRETRAGQAVYWIETLQR